MIFHFWCFIGGKTGQRDLAGAAVDTKTQPFHSTVHPNRDVQSCSRFCCRCVYSLALRVLIPASWITGFYFFFFFFFIPNAKSLYCSPYIMHERALFFTCCLFLFLACSKIRASGERSAQSAWLARLSLIIATVWIDVSARIVRREVHVGVLPTWTFKATTIAFWKD